ncbi:MAG: hypothetical protein IJA81_05830 [Akkermansia sp.]|nr:hypothetical protein [Akkermansia sp.]
MNDVSEISAIEIVQLVGYNLDSYEFIENTLVTIENHETFIDEFSKLKCKTHYSEPHSLEEGEVVIKVTYNNGEYELIHAKAQYRCRVKNRGYGYQIFDEEQFNSFLSSAKT